MVHSALIGLPPLDNGKDYWIVRAILITEGLLGKMPVEGGAIIPPVRPADYHFETQGPAIIAGSVISIVCMATITGLRLWLRWTHNGLHWGVDDWIMIPSIVLALLYPVLNIVGVELAASGKHMYDTTYYEFYMYVVVSTIRRMVFFIAVGLIKMSITFFNMRLTGVTSRKWMTAHWTFFTLLVGFVLASFFATLFECKPISGGFNIIADGHLDFAPKCISQNKLTNGLSIIHVLMDIWLMGVPIFILWKLQLGRKAKIRLSFVFSIGLMSIIGSIFRQVAQQKQGTRKSDFIWNSTSLEAWALVDLTFGVAVASLPMLSSLLPKKWLRDTTCRGTKILGTTTASRPMTTVISTITASRKESTFKPTGAGEKVTERWSSVDSGTPGIRVHKEFELKDQIEAESPATNMTTTWMSIERSPTVAGDDVGADLEWGQNITRTGDDDRDINSRHDSYSRGSLGTGAVEAGARPGFVRAISGEEIPRCYLVDDGMDVPEEQIGWPSSGA